MNGFIVVGYSDNNAFYVSNTSPITWANKISESKIFDSYRRTKSELEENFISLSATITNTNLRSIFILEYSNDIEVGREKFL